MQGLDCFRLLDMPPRPMLDEASLKAHYLSKCTPTQALSSEEGQPVDQAHLHEAYRILQSVPLRLRHLFQGIGGSELGNLTQVPEAIGARFMEVGELVGKLDQVIREKPSEGAAELAQVLFLKRAMPARKQAERMQSLLQSDLESLQASLSDLDAAWPAPGTAVSGGLLSRLKDLTHAWTFQEKWRRQLSDRLLELTV